jgi:hypothetical protein
MRTTFKFSDPSELEVEITLRGTLKEMTLLRKQLPSEFPSWKVANQITDVVMQAEKQFYSRELTDEQ